MLRGWAGLYMLSVRLGLRSLMREGYSREAAIRVLVPLEGTRFLELPELVRELRAAPGERVLDLASPKLAAVALARSGVRVTSIDELEAEVETWSSLARGVPNVDFRVADGRNLDWPDASFDHGYSISVLEHIPEPGDERALAELARVTRSGGRVVLTLPYSRVYREDWSDAPAYANHGAVDGRYFFARWYDDARLQRLLAVTPNLELSSTRTVAYERSRLWMAYRRMFPWSAPFTPLVPLALREQPNAAEGMVRLTLVRR
jgi:SAM-dependent methyltransferase